MDLGTLFVKIGADVSGLVAAQQRIQESLRSIERATQAPASGFSRLQASIVTFNQALQVLGRGAAAVERVATAYAGLADTASNLAARVKLVTSGSQEFAAVQSELFRIAQQSRGSLEATTELYARLARSTKDLGISQTEILRITETLNKSFAVSGVASSEAAAGLLQFSQGLASGKFQGDELRSILENLPPVAKAIADEFGVSVGQLKELGAQGELSAQRVLRAISGIAPEVDRQFGQIPKTIGQSFQQLENQLLQSVGQLDQASGISKEFSGAIDSLTAAVRDFFNLLVEHKDTIHTLAQAMALTIKGMAAFGLAAAETALGTKKLGDAASVADPQLQALGARIGLTGEEIREGLADAATAPGILQALRNAGAGLDKTGDDLNHFAGGASAAAKALAEVEKSYSGSLRVIDANTKAFGDSTEQLESRLQAAHARFDGLAELSNGTFTPAMQAAAQEVIDLEQALADTKGQEKLKEDFDELSKKLGQDFVKATQDASKGFDDLVAKLEFEAATSGLDETQKKIAETTRELQKLGTDGGKTGEEIAAGIESATTSIQNTAKAASRASNIIGDAFEDMIAGIASGTQDLSFDGITDALKSALAASIKEKLHFDDLFKGNIFDLVETLGGFLTGSDGLVGIFSTAFDAILGHKEGTLDKAFGGLFGGGGANGTTGIDGTQIGGFVAGAGGAVGGGLLGSKLGGTAGGIVGALLGKVLTDNAFSYAVNGTLTPYTTKIISTVAPQVAQSLGVSTSAAASLLSKNLGVVNSGAFGSGANALDAAYAARQGIAFEGAQAGSNLAGTNPATSALIGNAGKVLGVVGSLYSAYGALKGPGSSDERGIEVGHQLGLGIASIFDGGISKIVDTVLSRAFGKTFGQFIGGLSGLGPSKGQLGRRFLGNEVLGGTQAIGGLEGVNFDPYKSGLTTIDKAAAAYPELFAKAGNAAKAFGTVLSSAYDSGQSDAKEFNFVTETLIDNLGRAGKDGTEGVVRIAAAMRELGINSDQALQSIRIAFEQGQISADQYHASIQGLAQITSVTTDQMVDTLKAGLNKEALDVFERMVGAGAEAFDAVTVAGNAAFVSIAAGLQNGLLPNAVAVFQQMAALGITSAEAVARAWAGIGAAAGQFPGGNSGAPGWFVGADSKKLFYGSFQNGQFVPAGAPPTSAQEQRDLRGTAHSVPGFATGGIVPGPIGRPRVAVVHGGEAVLTSTELSTLRGSLAELSASVRGMKRRGTGAGEVQILPVAFEDDVFRRFYRGRKEGRYIEGSPTQPDKPMGIR